VPAVNVFTVALDEPFERGSIANHGVEVAPLIGARRLGAGAYEVEAGKWVWPYHYHHGVEEWLYVVAGSPVLRDPGGERVLAPGDLVAFPSGPTGAHTVGGPGRFVIFSVGGRPHPSICVYPDSDKLGARPGASGALDNLNFRRGDAIDYWAGEGSADEPGAPQILREPQPGESRPVINVLSVAVTPAADEPPGFQMSRVRCAPLIGAAELGAAQAAARLMTGSTWS
jgi:uncharacterized cupin superfamily protein